MADDAGVAPTPVVVLKRGAGLLLTCQGEGLLLKRTSFHNHNKWGLPGGNVEGEDADLFQTAVRESTEEMGRVPEPLHIVGSVPTKRGKGTKVYTVFIAQLMPEQRAAYTPVLNHEHSEWRWFPLETLHSLHHDELHPVVEKLAGKHEERLKELLGPRLGAP